MTPDAEAALAALLASSGRTVRGIATALRWRCGDKTDGNGMLRPLDTFRAGRALAELEKAGLVEAMPATRSGQRWRAAP